MTSVGLSNKIDFIKKLQEELKMKRNQIKNEIYLEDDEFDKEDLVDLSKR